MNGQITDAVAPEVSNQAAPSILHIRNLHASVDGNEILRGQALVDRLFKGGETPEARLLMGVAHLQRGDYRAAVPELERAVALSDALPGAHSLLGRALMGAGRRDDAIKAFTAELARTPNDFDANLYLGIMLKDDGKLDEAYATYRAALKSNPALAAAAKADENLAASPPAGFVPFAAPGRIVKVGNAALLGASMVLLSRSRRVELEALVARVEHVRLETHPSFFEFFVEGCQLEPFGAEALPG